MLGRIGFLGIVALGLFVIISGAGGKASAKVTVTCAAPDAPTASARFEWKAPKQDAVQSWLDVSLAPDFTPGWYQPHGPFAPSDNVTTLDGLPQGRKFYYRVNTLYPGEWKQTAHGSFTAECAPPTPAASHDPAASMAGTAVASGVQHAVQTEIAGRLP